MLGYCCYFIPVVINLSTCYGRIAILQYFYLHMFVIAFHKIYVCESVQNKKKLLTTKSTPYNSFDWYYTLTQPTYCRSILYRGESSKPKKSPSFFYETTTAVFFLLLLVPIHLMFNLLLLDSY